MKKFIVLIVVILVSIGSSYSQSLFTVSYEIGLPSGDFKDFIDKAGTRGLRVNGNWFINDNVTLGGTVGWSAFGQKFDRNTYQLEDGAITSNNWNRLYSVPFMFNAFYHLMPEGNIRPYVGGGLGSYFVEQELQAGRYLKSAKNWKMGIAPEIGAYIPFDSMGNFGVNAKLAYNLVFYNVEGIKNLSYISFAIGIGIGD